MARSKRSAAARKGWATKRAQAAERSRRATQGWATRRANARIKATRQTKDRIGYAFKHGQQARERSEARLTPAQKAARTRAGNRLAAQIAHERRSAAARRGWATRRAHAEGRSEPASARQERTEPAATAELSGKAIRSLDDLDDYPDDDFGEDFDLETSPDYEEANA